MTGLYCEPLPKGFGFSETAFRVFVLMASRRLKSDRFFTDDYRPEIYTEFGLDYIEQELDADHPAAPLPASGAGARRRQERVSALEEDHGTGRGVAR